MPSADPPPGAPSRAALETMAKSLEASGFYRVLRQLEPPAPRPAPPGARIGVIVDVETTGLDPKADEIIELGMTRFAYDASGSVVAWMDDFQAYREPERPIPPEVTELTGIDAATVAGCVIDAAAVVSFIAPAGIVIAHNAAFDRKFLERLVPEFAVKAFACSMEEAPWRAEGFEGKALPFLAAQSGFFFTGHRASDDARATLALLERPLPKSGRTALALLLERARRPTWRIWAEGAPFERKDDLRRRGYRWSAGDDGRPRAWWTEVDEAALEEEETFLSAEIYGRPVEPLKRRVTAFDRWSDRV